MDLDILNMLVGGGLVLVGYAAARVQPHTKGKEGGDHDEQR